METATIYTITIDPVEMGGWFVLTLVIGAVLVLGIFLTWKLGYSDVLSLETALYVSAFLLSCMLITLFVVADYGSTTVNQRIETQLRQDIGLEQIFKQESGGIRDGFIALKDGQAVTGTIKEVGRDRYEVTLRSYK